MSSLKVDNLCVYNLIFMILRGFINSGKGKILSNDSRTAKSVLFNVYRSIWGGVVQERFKDNWVFFGFLALGFVYHSLFVT